VNWKNLFPKGNRYFETENGILYYGDNAKILKTFPKELIDAIITDPPYEISRDNNFHTMKRNGIHFGEWDFNFNMEIWLLLDELINRNGSFVSFMAFEQYGNFIKIIDKTKLIIKDKLIWRKTNPMPRNRDRRYMADIEFCVWGVKKKAKWVFNRQNEKYESSVTELPSENGGGFKRYHPTQKPLKLLDKIIKIHTNEHQLILDPFSGSGTTLVAAEKLNRRWIGIELEEKYCKIAKQRLEEVIK